MADVLWPFADQFGVWHTSLPNGPLSFFRLSNEFHGANCPLKFEGTTQTLSQLFDRTAEPPYPVSQAPYLSLKDFVCWLQLPRDVEGTEWYFGCVFFEQKHHRQKLFDEFRELAAKAGACLRQNPRFREWLWPCMQYLTQADRHPKLRDGEDAAWWVAMLFTTPDICKLLHAACTRNDIADVVTGFQIDNPARWSRTAIHSWQLYGNPLWPIVNCPVAPPFQDIPCPDYAETPEVGRTELIEPPAGETSPEQATQATADDSGKLDGYAGTDGKQSRPLQNCEILAYRSFDYARSKTEIPNLTAQESYDFWNDRERGLDDADRDKFPQLIGYDPGKFSSYKSQLSRARNHPSIDDACYGGAEQKEKGSSIVARKEI